ncbi:MAG TPA: pyridoxal-phosphate dependent enzyme [Candidatus Polarisedimenticolia bacterium]|nr:pyridoxal-phosphate dependent enzyme [Candidatus Polarisedimenticolia bacterium]
MKNVHNDVGSAVGWTPLVRINRVGRDTSATFYAKLEYLNPGSSVKDRIAVQIVEDAEQSGRLKPGGTLVECTSGNTGMGLAMVGAARGYQTIFVMPDKVSDEKIKALRAFGAKVITTPTAVPPEDPRSYYSVARRISETTPNSFFANQYQNASNPEAHFRTTGPEIWEQIGESLDAVVVATGTGGTLTGIARYIKPLKPSVQMVLVDPVGSIYYDYLKTGKAPRILKTYKVEGFGEDFIPGTIDLKLVDEVVQVSDKECFVLARELTRKEGLFGGGSCGGAMAGAIKFARAHPECRTIVVILPDSGSRYLSKVYDDAWLRENSFLDEGELEGKVEDLLHRRQQRLITAQAGDGVREVIALMKEHGISQVPVLEGEELVGMLSESGLLGAMLADPAAAHRSVGQLTEPNYGLVEPSAPISRLSEIVSQGKVALVMEAGRLQGVVTKFDLIEYLAAASR